MERTGDRTHFETIMMLQANHVSAMILLGSGTVLSHTALLGVYAGESSTTLPTMHLERGCRNHGTHA